MGSTTFRSRRPPPEGLVDDAGDELQPAQLEELSREEPQVWIGFAQALDATTEKRQVAVKARDRPGRT